MAVIGFVLLVNPIYLQPTKLRKSYKMVIDLNCDLGEGMATDASILPFISSANIACGYHAGDAEILKRTVDACLQNKVAAGAHPAFKDKENFGRNEMVLNEFQLYDIICDQLYFFEDIAFPMGCIMHHVKLHGALYNMAAKDAEMANVIIRAIKDFDENLILYGLSGSLLLQVAQDAGLKTAHETFADRTYQDDGSLTSRNQPNALLQNVADVVKHALQMVNEGSVTTLSGKIISLKTDTICLHGDGENALVFAQALHENLKAAGYSIKAM